MTSTATVTGIKYYYPNILLCIYIRSIGLGQATTRVGSALGVSEIDLYNIYIYIAVQ